MYSPDVDLEENFLYGGDASILGRPPEHKNTLFFNFFERPPHTPGQSYSHLWIERAAVLSIERAHASLALQISKKNTHTGTLA